MQAGMRTLAAERGVQHLDRVHDLTLDILPSPTGRGFLAFAFLALERASYAGVVADPGWPARGDCQERKSDFRLRRGSQLPCRSTYTFACPADLATPRAPS